MTEKDHIKAASILVYELLARDDAASKIRLDTLIFGMAAAMSAMLDEESADNARKDVIANCRAIACDIIRGATLQ